MIVLLSPLTYVYVSICVCVCELVLVLAKYWEPKTSFYYQSENSLLEARTFWLVLTTSKACVNV